MPFGKGKTQSCTASEILMLGVNSYQTSNLGADEVQMSTLEEEA